MVDPALGKRLLQFGRIGCGGLGDPEPKQVQASHPFEMYQVYLSDGSQQVTGYFCWPLRLVRSIVVFFFGLFTRVMCCPEPPAMMLGTVCQQIPDGY